MPEFKDADFNDMLAEILRIYKNYRIDKIYIDGSRPEIIRAVKDLVEEPGDNYNEQIKRYESKGWDPMYYFKVLPIHFMSRL
jgi:hypothetical protein